MKELVKGQWRRARDYVRFKTGELSGRRGERFEGHYAVWRSRRIQTILDEYPARFFEGKTVLELGAGYGAIGAFFGAIGASVNCLEGRAQNVRVIRERYPFLKAAEYNLNEGIPGTGSYYAIIHLGVLYHLKDPEHALRETAQRCDHLILETEVTDSDDPNLVHEAQEYSYIYDQALDNAGSRPSSGFVERILAEEGFAFRRLSDSRCNWELHEYDWPARGTGQFRNGQRRMWFASKEGGPKS